MAKGIAQWIENRCVWCSPAVTCQIKNQHNKRQSEAASTCLAFDASGWFPPKIVVEPARLSNPAQMAARRLLMVDANDYAQGGPLPTNAFLPQRHACQPGQHHAKHT